jgi:hypothetical protein
MYHAHDYFGKENRAEQIHFLHNVNLSHIHKKKRVYGIRNISIIKFFRKYNLVGSYKNV